MSVFLRLSAVMALACLTGGAGPADAAAGAIEDRPAARPSLTVDRVLAMRTFGAATLSPDGAWAVWERRRPYDTAPRFDRGHRSGWALGDLMIASVAGGAPEALLPTESGTGLLVGSWSPDGRRLLVYRLDGDRFEAGVVDVGQRRVVWTGLTPDLVNGVSAAWLDADRLALTVRPAGDLPWSLRFDGAGAAEAATRWGRTAAGREPSRSRIETRGRLTTIDAGLPTLQLVVLDLAAGGRRTLVEGAIRDFAAAPDGDWLAVVMSAERAPADPEVVVQSAVQTRSRLRLVGTRGEPAPAPDRALDLAPHLLRWSADSRSVLVWSRRDGERWAEGRLRAVRTDGTIRDFDTTGLEPLEPGGHIDELRIVQADWLGESVVLRARPEGSARRDWWRLGAGAPLNLTAALAAPPSRLSASWGDRVLAFADGRLWALGGPEGALPVSPMGETVSDGETFTLMTPSRLRANEAPRRDRIAARSAGGTRALDVDSDAGQSEGGDGAVGSARRCDGELQGRAAAGRALLTVCLDGGVETLALAAPGNDRVLDEVNGDFRDVRIPRPQPIRHRDAFGAETTSWLHLPADRDVGAVRGMVVMVYPGVVDDGRYLEPTSLGVLGPRAQLLAASGYAVLSAALADESGGARGAMMEDFVRGADRAVEAALAAEPDLPSDRLALLGHSFGGYAALSIATRSERYRSVIAWAAPTDPAGKWGEFGPHFRTWPEQVGNLDASMAAVERGQAMMGGPPWADVTGYAAASPVMQADRIRTPVLLITADRDYVSMTQAERLLSALHRQGKWGRLVTYWGEGHSNASPANVRDVYREMIDWLDRTLGPEALTPRAGAAPMPEPSSPWPPSP